MKFMSCGFLCPRPSPRVALAGRGSQPPLPRQVSLWSRNRGKLQGRFRAPASSLLLPAICLLCATPPALRAEEFSQLSRYSARLFSFGTLRIDTRVGDVRIEGWDEPRVEIEAEKIVRASSAMKSQDLYDQVKIELQGKDKEVRLRTLYPRRRLWRPFRGESKLSVNLRIHMPYDANLTLECVNGDVHIVGIAGHQTIKVNFGDVVITVPSVYRLRSLQARAWLGDVGSDLNGQEGVGFSQKLSFWNPDGDQDISVRVRLGGVSIYRGGD